MSFVTVSFGQDIANQNSQQSENYYIQPANIFMIPNGIYVSIDGEVIQINMLCADERGIFVPYEELLTKLVKCPFCQRMYDPTKHHNCQGVPE